MTAMQSALFQAISGKCLDCKEDSGAVSRCTSRGCGLYPYRLGRSATRAENDGYEFQDGPAYETK